MNDRQRQIAGLLEARGELAVTELVSVLSASEATVRRDLAALEKSGVLVRTFGGARLRDRLSLVARTFAQKREAMRSEKERIAKRAAELVEPGMSVALDSGTTTWRVAAALRDKAPLDIVTNALPVVEELGAVDGIRIHCAGGRFNLSNLDFMGAETAKTLAKFHVNIAFLGIDCLIPGRGICTDTQEDADNLRAMRASCDTCVVLADHSKLNAAGLLVALQSDEIDCVIMDDGVTDQLRTQLEADPCELIIAC